MSLPWYEYLSNPSYESDNQAKAEFGRKLLLAFKQKNIAEGITFAQAIYLHDKIKNLDVIIPGQPPMKIDIINMALVGDIEAGCFALMYCVPDDMSKSYHWLSQDRINWIVTQCKSFLGWP